MPLCFIAYVWLALTRSAERGVRSGQLPPPNAQPSTIHTIRHFLSPVTRRLPLADTCRSALVLLLIGFWFDGGLFKLATGTIFWVLLELSRAPLRFLSPSGGERIPRSDRSRLEPLNRRRERSAEHRLGQLNFLRTNEPRRCSALRFMERATKGRLCNLEIRVGRGN